MGAIRHHIHMNGIFSKKGYRGGGREVEEKKAISHSRERSYLSYMSIVRVIYANF